MSIPELKRRVEQLEVKVVELDALARKIAAQRDRESERANGYQEALASVISSLNLVADGATVANNRVAETHEAKQRAEILKGSK